MFLKWGREKKKEKEKEEKKNGEGATSQGIQSVEAEGARKWNILTVCVAVI